MNGHPVKLLRTGGWIVALALLGAACAGDAAEGSADATRNATDGGSDGEVPMDTVFAEDLELDLARMTRTESGLYYEDIEPGSGLAARDGHVLDTHYTGWLTTGAEFGTSREGSPYSFQLGRRQAPRGIEEGVTGMRIGGVRRLVVPPSLGYGSRGQPPTIPPSATLVYEIELLDIKL